MTVDNLTVLGLLKVLRQVKLDELTVTKINELSGEDLSELVSNLADIQEKLTTIQTTINDCKLEASVFKTGIADAIKNIDSTATVTGDSNLTDFTSGIQNIVPNVTSDATATASNILSGKTAYVNGNKVTGTMNNYSGAETPRGATANITSVVKEFNIDVGGYYGIVSFHPCFTGYIDANTVINQIVYGLNPNVIKAGQLIGAYSGSGDSAITGTFTSDANATSNQILSGYTAYVNGSKVSGGVPIRSGSSQALVVATGSGGLYQVFNGGYYPYESHFANSNTSEVYSPLSSVASALGITANKILSGYTICGVSGTAFAGYGVYEGSMSSTTRWGNVNCTFSFLNGTKSISDTWTSLTTSSYNSRFTYNSKPTGLNVEYAFCKIHSSYGIRRGNGYSSGTTNASYRYLNYITIFAEPWDNYIPEHGTSSLLVSEDAIVGLWNDCNVYYTSSSGHKSCNIQFTYTPSTGKITVDFFYSGANTLAVRTDLLVDFYLIYKR